MSYYMLLKYFFFSLNIKNSLIIFKQSLVQQPLQIEAGKTNINTN